MPFRPDKRAQWEEAMDQHRVGEPMYASHYPEVPEDKPSEPPQSGMAPLLRQLMEQYRARGLPPAYLPQPQRDDEE